MRLTLSVHNCVHTSLCNIRNELEHCSTNRGYWNDLIYDLLPIFSDIFFRQFELH